MTDINEVIKVLDEIKALKRSGWIKREVETPESDADHQWGVSFLVLLYASEDKNLDLLKCLKLAVVHDIHEFISGDYTPDDEITPEDRYLSEYAAVVKIAGRLNYPELVAMFEEFEAQETPEAKFVKSLDRLETACQAKFYDDNGKSSAPLMPEFGEYAKKKISDKRIKKLLSEIK